MLEQPRRSGGRAAFLAERLVAPQLLVGHSLGGTAVLSVAERLDSVRAVATLAAPSSPTNVLRHFDGQLDRIAKNASACSRSPTVAPFTAP